jgi:cell division protein FtsI/penicillin-binding protein 2
MRSDSARFLDRMFCFDKAFANCARPWNVQAEASAFGWNAGCNDAREDCGKRDLLFGRSVNATFDSDPSLAMVVTYGRLFVEPTREDAANGFRITPRMSFDPVKLRACSLGADGRRGTNDDWGKCRGGIVVDAVAEGWGQGNARSSALGVAGMMATLAAAANGTSSPTPHLVEDIRSVGPAHGDVTSRLSLQPVIERSSDAQRIPTEVAELILNALSYTHRGGTARLACEQVFDAKSCRDFDWIAGKTGTPTFPNDDVTLDELARRCAPGMPRGRHEEASCGALRPYKWYVAAYRTDASNPRWTKVIGVLTERNFLADTGRIHGAGDHGPNPAAEIALQIAGRHAGYLGASK